MENGWKTNREEPLLMGYSLSAHFVPHYHLRDSGFHHQMTNFSRTANHDATASDKLTHNRNIYFKDTFGLPSFIIIKAVTSQWDRSMYTIRIILLLAVNRTVQEKDGKNCAQKLWSYNLKIAGILMYRREDSFSFSWVIKRVRKSMRVPSDSEVGNK